MGAPFRRSASWVSGCLTKVRSAPAIVNAYPVTMPEHGVQPPRAARKSVAYAITGFACVLLAMLSSLILYLVLDDLHFGTQIATAIVYTGVVWAYTFLHTNLGPSYRLNDPTVQRAFPKLLLIHVAFLFLLFTFQTTLFALKSSLPPSWLVESGPKHDSVYKWLSLIPPILIGATQVFWLRRILHRSFLGSLRKSG